MAMPIILKPKRICQVPGCTSRHTARGYCNRHYMQYRAHGKISGNPTRSRLDPNKFIINGDTCEIMLYDNDGCYTNKAIINAEDYEKVAKFKWYLNAGGYAVSGNNPSIYLHRLIFGDIPNGYGIDHIDRDTLNSKMCNLRLATKIQNSANQKLHKRNTSGFKGVTYSKDHNKWYTSIYVKGEKKFIGYFQDSMEAAKAYDMAAVKYNGEFASTNKSLRLLLAN